MAYYFISRPTRAFNHPSFLTSFPESYLSFVISQDPNVKLSQGDIKPPWSKFGYGGGERLAGREMMFNRTEAGELDITEVATDGGLAERCRYVWEYGI